MKRNEIGLAASFQLLYAIPGTGKLGSVNLNTLVEETVAALDVSSIQSLGRVRLSIA